ncbi:hypothetical protein HanXRQr2_Chr13g0572181 [Helianthus annuus]|uniref:Uncharacterized protein n=1 Tax=Helianthus annuus TaxID=4232 RepID=A0A9K3H8W0_HELAN|nr:hypothetical protein HanXRQr2_Chr13g0572181 [Helianthus annuus]KAJ0496517.1 hypothetical protein HanHA89_Chr13g0500711 [Helianthus annuus]
MVRVKYGSSFSAGFGSTRVKPGQHMLKSVNNSQPGHLWVRVNTLSLAVRGSVRSTRSNRVHSVNRFNSVNRVSSTSQLSRPTQLTRSTKSAF